MIIESLNTGVSIVYPIETLRHSAAHIMAAAVCRLFPDTQIDIGPATENGFYYDFDMEPRLVAEDLKAIEKAMKKLIGRGLPFERFETDRDVPDAIRAALGAARGGKVTFIVENGEIRVVNAALHALAALQAKLTGAAGRAGLPDEQAVSDRVASFRKEGTP